MTRKHKGNKHEETRKAVPASAARAPSKAAKLTRQAKPHPTELPDAEESPQSGTRLIIQSDESESGLRDTLRSVEIQVIDSLEERETRSEHVEVEAVEVIADVTPSFLEPHLPMSSRWDAVQASGCDFDLVYKSAEEQVTLAMLEAEQAAALCEWSGDFPPIFYLEDSFGLAGPHPFVPESVFKASVDSASEDGPFAFDHI